MWEIILSEQFEVWIESLDADSYDAVLVKLAILREFGPALGRPHADTLKQSRIKNLKELRIQCKRHVYRILFSFDPKRNAVILIGGDKRGNERLFYKKIIPLAEAIFERYLREVDKL